MAKVGAGVFCLLAPRRHSHKAVNFQSLEVVEDSQFFERFIGVKSVFAGFAGNIDFEKHGDCFGEFFAGVVEGLGDSFAVDAVDPLRDSGGFAAFVGLQMPNEVPAQMARTLRCFLFEFLNFAFSERG